MEKLPGVDEPPTPLLDVLSRQVNNAPPLMRQHQKHIQDLKVNRGDREKVNGNQALEVVLQERSPGL